MMQPKTTSKGFAAIGVAIASAAVLSLPGSAQAQYGERRYEAEPSFYPIEVEPHFAFGPDNVYGNDGYGGGIRFSIPIVQSLLVHVPDNLAISFGGDLIHYDNCFFPNQCGANYLMIPLALQWNVFVLRRLSLFGEGGAFLYKGFFDECSLSGGPGCNPPSDFGVLPTFAVGLRVHLSDSAALTARIGYPTTTLGLSFL